LKINRENAWKNARQALLNRHNNDKMSNTQTA